MPIFVQLSLCSNSFSKLKIHCSKMGICLMLAVKNCNFIFFGKILIMFGFLALSNLSSLCSTFPHFASPFFLILLFLASLNHVPLRSIFYHFDEPSLALLNHFSLRLTFIAILAFLYSVAFLALLKIESRIGKYKVTTYQRDTCTEENSYSW